MKGDDAMEILGIGNVSDDPQREACFYCRKSAGLEGEPWGGYIHRDERWIVNHVRAQAGQRGTIIASSRRHLLDVTEMTREERESFVELERRLIRAVKQATGAERVYTLAMMANVAHFHTWFIPQHKGSPLKAIDLLASERRCDDVDVLAVSDRLREILRSA